MFLYLVKGKAVFSDVRIKFGICLNQNTKFNVSENTKSFFHRLNGV
jgi:hypothetical protein